MNPPRFLLGASFVALVAALSAQTTDGSAPPSRIAGKWQVAYEDLALGEIDGTATIAPDGKHATVVLAVGPESKSYTLTAESITVAGDEYTLVLAGESPSSPGLMPDTAVAQQAGRARQDATTTVFVISGSKLPPMIQVPSQPTIRLAPPLPGPRSGWAYGQPTQPPDVHLTIPGDAGTIGLEVADYQATLPFKPMRPIETRRIVLTLHFRAASDSAGYAGAAGDLLVGTWKYYADPITWRDAEGRGRVGYFRRDPENTNLTTQSAAETWFRPNPPAQMHFLAMGPHGEIRIRHLFAGVPTIVEAVFDAPQDDDTISIDVQIGERKFPMNAHKDPENARRFTTEPFLPGPDSRPSPQLQKDSPPDENDPEKGIGQ